MDYLQGRTRKFGQQRVTKEKVREVMDVKEKVLDRIKVKELR